MLELLVLKGSKEKLAVRFELVIVRWIFFDLDFLCMIDDFFI